MILSAELTHRIQDVLTAWEGPAPRLVYVTDAGFHPTQYFEEVLCRMLNPRNPGKYLSLGVGVELLPRLPVHQEAGGGDRRSRAGCPRLGGQDASLPEGQAERGLGHAPQRRSVAEHPRTGGQGIGLRAGVWLSPPPCKLDGLRTLSPPADGDRQRGDGSRLQDPLRTAIQADGHEVGESLRRAPIFSLRMIALSRIGSSTVPRCSPRKEWQGLELPAASVTNTPRMPRKPRDWTDRTVQIRRLDAKASGRNKGIYRSVAFLLGRSTQGAGNGYQHEPARDCAPGSLGSMAGQSPPSSTKPKTRMCSSHSAAWRKRFREDRRFAGRLFGTSPSAGKALNWNGGSDCFPGAALRATTYPLPETRSMPSNRRGTWRPRSGSGSASATIRCPTWPIWWPASVSGPRGPSSYRCEEIAQGKLRAWSALLNIPADGLLALADAASMTDANP